MKLLVKVICRNRTYAYYISTEEDANKFGNYMYHHQKYDIIDDVTISPTNYDNLDRDILELVLATISRYY